MHEVMRLHIEAAPPPLREKNKKIPKKTAAIVMQALAKNPDERPASAAGFASALRASARRDRRADEAHLRALQRALPEILSPLASHLSPVIAFAMRS